MDDLRLGQLETRLARHLEDVKLQALSRIPAQRLKTTALPAIGVVELVSPESFRDSYQSLYLSMFHGDERERPELIVQRLHDEFAGLRVGLSPYRVVGIKSRDGTAIAAAQFSVLFLPDGKSVVPYMQYIYVRTENRRQDLSEVLHTMALAVATVDGNAVDGHSTVPFTLFETEPPNYGTSEGNRTNATRRAEIHTKSGSKALMLLDESGLFHSSHVQPGLEVGHRDRHVTLTWGIRPSPAMQRLDMTTEMGTALLAAYYRSMREEGFPEENVAFAENIANARCVRRQFVEIPLSDVTMDMVNDSRDVNSNSSA